MCEEEKMHVNGVLAPQGKYTVWLNSHQEGSNCPDVENNLHMSAALQVTAHIFGVPFKPASITTYVMQRPIQFTDEMKNKDAFKPFAQKFFF